MTHLLELPLFIVLVEVFVAAEHCIPHREECGVAANVVRVVVVVVGGCHLEWYEAGGAPGELVATMSIMRLYDPDCSPDLQSHEMDIIAEDQGTHKDWEHVAYHEFDWMRVFRSDTDCVLVAVVDFMDVRVDPTEVQESVRTMEASIFTNSAKQNSNKHLERTRDTFNIHQSMYLPVL